MAESNEEVNNIEKGLLSSEKVEDKSDAVAIIQQTPTTQTVDDLKEDSITTPPLSNAPTTPAADITSCCTCTDRLHY